MPTTEPIIHWLTQYLDISVFAVLGAMSVVLIALVIERVWALSRFNVSPYQTEIKLDADLTKRLTLMATIGSIAPYIGLLGTVLGILVTFFELGNAEQIDAQAVMMGLALALKATAAGLIVAIPAIIAYNQFMRRVDVLIARWHDERAS